MKKLLSIAALAALVLTACSKDLQVKTVDKLTVEYGDKLDNSKLFQAKESDENVKVDMVNGFEEKKLGEQTLKVTFTNGDKTIEKEIKVTIKDTKKPVITLKKDKITITAGDKLTLKNNVKSVKDPVDGDLKYSEKKIEKSGYYIDKDKLNTKKAGTYEIKVFAYDANGNAAEKTFKVIVNKKEVVKQEPPQSQSLGAQESNGTDQAASSTSPSSSWQASQGSGNKSEQNNTQPSGVQTTEPASKPQTCTVPSNQIGNSGQTFKTEAAAYKYGEEMDSNPNNNIAHYGVMEITDTCENVVGWTVEFGYK